MQKETCRCGKHVKVMKDGRLMPHNSPREERDEYGVYYPRCPYPGLAPKATR